MYVDLTRQEHTAKRIRCTSKMTMDLFSKREKQGSEKKREQNSLKHDLRIFTERFHALPAHGVFTDLAQDNALYGRRG